MFRETYPQKKITTFSSARAGLSLTGETNALPFMNPARNFDLIIFDLVRAGAAQRNRASRSVERFFKRDQNICFDIGSALGRRLASAEPAESGATTPSAEKSFEKVAEASPTELKLDS